MFWQNNFYIHTDNGLEQIVLAMSVRANGNPDSKVHENNMGPTWILSAPDGPHVGPMNHAISEMYTTA